MSPNNLILNSEGSSPGQGPSPLLPLAQGALPTGQGWWSPGEVPELWGKVTITPVFKRGSKEHPGNHKPISFTFIPRKVIEQLILYVISKPEESSEVSKRWRCNTRSQWRCPEASEMGMSELQYFSRALHPGKHLPLALCLQQRLQSPPQGCTEGVAPCACSLWNQNLPPFFLLFICSSLCSPLPSPLKYFLLDCFVRF